LKRELIQTASVANLRPSAPETKHFQPENTVIIVIARSNTFFFVVVAVGEREGGGFEVLHNLASVIGSRKTH
jgi:hypothetical protein